MKNHDFSRHVTQSEKEEKKEEKKKIKTFKRERKKEKKKKKKVEITTFLIGKIPLLSLSPFLKQERPRGVMVG